MNELLMLTAMSISGLFFGLGGYRWKYLRRYVLPLCLGIIALLGGFIWWKCLLYALGLVIAFCLPYGERTPYPIKFLVFCAYSLPSLLFGFTAWQVLSPIICFGVFCLSNLKFSANTFVWKICEFILGSTVGITLASLISQTS